MDISAAAMPPIQPPISTADRVHPLFPTYSAYRQSMVNNLVQASAFRDWLFQYERDLQNDAVVRHAEYPTFLAWMRENKGGARQCPAGTFPHNFHFWREGGRW